MKVKAGVSPAHFKNFAVVNGKSLCLTHIDRAVSLVEVQTFTVDLPNAAQSMLEYLENVLLCDNPTYTAIVMIARGMYEVEFSHAAAFVRHESRTIPFLEYMDCSNHAVLVHKRKGAGRLDLPHDPLDLKEDFAKFYEFTLFALELRKVSPEKAEQIHSQMSFVMTGVHERGRSRQSEGAEKTHGKRKRKGGKGWGSKMQAKALG